MKATPDNLAKLIRQLFKIQAAEAARLTTVDGAPLDMTAWVLPMADAIRPLIAEMYRQGMVQASARIAAKLGRSPKRQESPVEAPTPHLIVPGASGNVRRTTLSSSDVFARKSPTLAVKGMRRVVMKAADFGLSFDLFGPKVIDAVDSLVLTLCRDTMATAAKESNEAIADLRRLLREGLPRGEANALLARKVRTIFADPMRAFRIAVTESSRAIHGGQMAAAIEAGVKRHSWLASLDACERCLELDGKTVDIGKPFWVDPKGGPYAVVLYPPLHPHCFCSTAEEI